MTTAQAIAVLKAALAALDQGNVAGARQLIVTVINGLEVKRHK